MKLWGGNYSADPDAAFWEFNRSFPFDRRLLARGDRGLARLRARARPVRGDPGRRGRARSTQGLAEVLRARAGGSRLPRPRRRGRAQLRRDAARRDRGRAGRPGPPRAQPQRAGGDRAAPLDPRRHRPPARGHRGPGARPWSTQGAAGRRRCPCPATPTPAPPSPSPSATSRPPTPGPWCATSSASRDARRRVNVLPLGSGALAGTALPLDREALARDLGFAAVSENALDAVIRPRLRRRVRLRLRPAPDPPVAPGRGPDPLLGARVRLRHPARGLHHAARA